MNVDGSRRALLDGAVNRHAPLARHLFGESPGNHELLAARDPLLLAGADGFLQVAVDGVLHCPLTVLARSPLMVLVAPPAIVSL